MDGQGEQEDFGWQQALPEGAVVVNGRVWWQDVLGVRAVFVDQVPFYCFPVQNEVQKRFTAVQLVEAELASVREVCESFSLSPRTFSRSRRQLQQGGIEALVKGKRGPRGRRAKTRHVATAIVRLYEDGQSVYDIASRVGLCPRTVGRVLKDQGVERRGNRRSGPSFFPETLEEASESACPSPCEAEEVSRLEGDENGGEGTSAGEKEAVEIRPMGEIPEAIAPEAWESRAEMQTRVVPLAGTAETAFGGAMVDACRPSAVNSEVVTDPEVTEVASQVEATSIPYADPLDRLLTVLGRIEEAPVDFASAEGVPQAGVLLGLALLGETHLMEEARAVYGQLKNSWYGLRSLLWTLIVMALLRIKRPEQIKFQDPVSLGQVLGLPRSAEVKTIRRKLREVAERGRAAVLHRRLAQRRVAADADPVATLYIDGHVRVYYGQHRLGKTYATRLNSVVRGETDYWVHWHSGHPLLVVHDAANGSFSQALREQVLPEIRRVIGKQRITVVFDRAGWCRELLWALLEMNVDFITYRKGTYEPLDESCFRKETMERDGHTVVYELAEAIFAEQGWPRLRLIAVKKKNGEQTHVVASGRVTWEAMNQPADADLPAVEVAWWMFGRWCQENWLKYMREEYALDVLVDYATEPADPHREVGNPARRKLDRQLRAARARLNREEARHAEWLRGERRARRQACKNGACGRCTRCCLLAQERALSEARVEVERLLQLREETPCKVPLGQASDRDPVKLSYERKLFTDTVKICAYEIETSLLEMALGSFRRASLEGRALIRDILQTSGGLRVTGETLEVHLDQLSTPRATRALMAICAQMNALQPRLPESPLQFRFFVNPRPVGE